MKKGFTLIELIMVITLLGIIAIITVPAIGNSINSSKEEAFKEQKKLIVNAAKQYMAMNYGNIQNGTSSCVDVSVLQSEGFLSKEQIKNPKYVSGSSDSEKSFEFFDGGSVVVTATPIGNPENKNFKYSYGYSSSKCS